jgi:hypothetical protein
LESFSGKIYWKKDGLGEVRRKEELFITSLVVWLTRGRGEGGGGRGRVRVQTSKLKRMEHLN